MDKNEVCQRISAVMRTLDTGIEVRGATNAGNLAGCFSILNETLDYLVNCNITPISEQEQK